MTIAYSSNFILDKVYSIYYSYLVGVLATWNMESSFAVGFSKTISVIADFSRHLPTEKGAKGESLEAHDSHLIFWKTWGQTHNFAHCFDFTIFIICLVFGLNAMKTQ